MADQFDFTNKTPPMQGISLADLIAAKQSPLTTVLNQGVNPLVQALQARRQEAKRQQLMLQASGGDPNEIAMMQLNPSYVPAQLKKERLALSPEFSHAIFENYKQKNPKAEDPFVDRDFLYQDEANLMLKGAPTAERTFTRKQDEQQFHTQQREKLAKLAPAFAASGLMKVASVNNARADRALQNLNDPNIVFQQLDGIAADVTGILAGGAPHESAMARQGYSNLLIQYSKLKSYITSTPAAINNPEVVKRLRKVIMDLKEVDNRIIQNGFDTATLSYRPTINYFKTHGEPNFEQDLKDQFMQATQGFGAVTPTPQGKSTGDPLGIL